MQWTGIPTSIGIANTKTLSKVANHIAKKKQSGVTSLIGIENLDPILEKVEINDVWGVEAEINATVNELAKIVRCNCSICKRKNATMGMVKRSSCQLLFKCI